MRAAFLGRTLRGHTPLYAQLVGTGLSCAVVLANESKGTSGLFTFLALLTASATLWLYLAVALGALKQRPRGFALVGVLAGLAFTLFAFYGSGLEANLWSLALLAAGIIMFAIMRMRHGPNPAPVAAQAAPRE